jgi:peptidoglycan/LPS O-acetylase OafA/YrhL
MNNINKERFILLDLLRFILAAIVVLYHYFYLSSIYGLVPVLNSSFKYLYICGYLGVHIFFNCFLLTLIFCMSIHMFGSKHS